MAEHFFQGMGVSAGVAVGAIVVYRPVELGLPQRSAASPAEEMARFHTARDRAREEMRAHTERAEARPGSGSGEIFSAHTVMLYDPMLEEAVEKRISRGMTVEAAVKHAAEEFAEMLRAVADEHFAERAVDVLNVGQRVLRILLGFPDISLTTIDQPSIVVAPDLTPSDTAHLDTRFVSGFCLSGGGQTSHAVILAQMLGIPAVVNLGQAFMDSLAGAQTLAMDGITGLVAIDPEPKTIEDYQNAQAQQKARARHQPGRAAANANERWTSRPCAGEYCRPRQR